MSQVEFTNKEIITKLREIMDEKDQIKAREKELNQDKEYMEGLLIPMMRAEGIDKFSTAGIGTASIKPKIIYSAEDWDIVCKFIVENNEPMLLQKRLSEAKIKELQEGGIEIPGIKKIELDKLNFRRSS